MDSHSRSEDRIDGFPQQVGGQICKKWIPTVAPRTELYNFITISGYLAGKREWVHFGPNPWDWDRNEICGHIFSGSRTEHTCSVRLVDFEVEGIEEK